MTCSQDDFHFELAELKERSALQIVSIHQLKFLIAFALSPLLQDSSRKCRLHHLTVRRVCHQPPPLQALL